MLSLHRDISTFFISVSFRTPDLWVSETPTKNYFFLSISAYYFLKVHLHHFSKIKSNKKNSHKTVGNKVLLLFLRIRIHRTNGSGSGSRRPKNIRQHWSWKCFFGKSWYLKGRNRNCSMERFRNMILLSEYRPSWTEQVQVEIIKPLFSTVYRSCYDNLKFKVVNHTHKLNETIKVKRVQP